jgi:anaerobic ribonucleoside-triphosphate reductase activating protein
VSGCRNHCPNCFQQETWDFDYGKPFTEERFDELMEMLSQEYIDGLTLLGGEPMEPENQEVLVGLTREVKEKLPDKSIWLYTGFTVEELQDKDCRANCQYTAELLSNVDVLVDGRFVEEKKDISLRFRGSSNQRLIDMNKSREAGEVVLWDDGHRRTMDIK